ncbi:MAG: hypothetical protein BroJett026_08060 [Betaproteobacteria bacterium]|nr:MAG: hypothetical protein BroJett026_08060 [Betaproteobacteria bacterium]
MTSAARRPRDPWRVAAAALLALACGAAGAQGTVTPTLSGRIEYTSNVNLSPDDQREHDVILSLTPGIAIDYRAPRASLQGSFAVPLTYYARASSSSRADVQAALRGSAEVLADLFFVDASINVSQSYANPFGPRPDDITSITENRQTSATYRLSPYLQRRVGNYRYLLRDDLTWTRFYDSPFDEGTTYSNRLFGTVERDATPYGWALDVYRDEYEFTDSRSEQLLERVRARGIWQPSPLFSAYVTGGYERNRFPLTRYEGETYGLGFTWRPTPRTNVDANWEKRFFGDSYLFNLDHRTRLAVFRLRASRDASSFPELLAQVPEGTFVPGLLNELLVARIPDPQERAQFIVDYMSSRGLPLVLNAPLELYTTRITVIERAVASVGLLGVRNSLFLSAFYSKSTPVTASGTEIPPLVAQSLDNNTQVGGTAVWSYRLSGLSSLSLSGTVTRTRANDPFTDESTQRIARLTFTRRVSPWTSVFAGARWQDFESDFSRPWDEYAVYAGFNYRFH